MGKACCLQTAAKHGAVILQVGAGIDTARVRNAVMLHAISLLDAMILVI
jgi:hypothetical protein